MSSTTVTSDFLYRLFGPYLFRFILHVRSTISFFKVSIDIRLSLDALKVKETFFQWILLFLSSASFKGVGVGGGGSWKNCYSIKSFIACFKSTAELQYVRFWEHKNNYTEFKLNQRVHLVIKRAFSQYFSIFISFLFVYWSLHREKLTFYTIAFVKCIVESWR